MAAVCWDQSITERTLLRAARPLSSGAYAAVRHRTIFECCKWDPQVGDTSTLCPFPLVIRGDEWSRLATWAEQLAAETMAAEREILNRPALLSNLGLPRQVTRPLAAIERHGMPCDAARVIRFDFHLCRSGWCISEANTDVPGGFIEASGFARLMAEYYDELSLTADSAAIYAEALDRSFVRGGSVALIHATAYTDDRQVMTFLARHFGERGLRSHLASPADLRWDSGRAQLVTSDGGTQPLAAVVRFFPGEWLPNLAGSCGWPLLFAGARTPLSNPATALVTQSKRFPLIWDRLATSLETWRSLLPETRSPRDVDWRRDDRWVIKPALGRVGDGIGLRGVTSEKDWRSIAQDAAWLPDRWVAQRRFDALPVMTSEGPRYPVIGVFTIDGRAAGIYGRLAARPLIDDKAQDVAVLVESKDGKNQG